MRCLVCLRKLAPPAADGPAVSISGGIAGDEYTETHFFCPDCHAYTVEVVHDRFLGETTVLEKGPLSEADGLAKLEIVRRCPQPWDKKCRCPAHRAYFGDSLD